MGQQHQSDYFSHGKQHWHFLRKYFFASSSLVFARICLWSTNELCVKAFVTLSPKGKRQRKVVFHIIKCMKWFVTCAFLPLFGYFSSKIQNMLKVWKKGCVNMRRNFAVNRKVPKSGTASETFSKHFWQKMVAESYGLPIFVKEKARKFFDHLFDYYHLR